MTMTDPMRTVKEPVWTPRQREVLDLLVRRKTNSEIAGLLGISLDGAKWHVSEIITSLGVDSREEAAEYWRHHNGLSMRFTRIASGLFSSGVLKWGMGTAFIVGVVVTSAIVIVALRETGGESSGPSAGDPPAATPDPGQTPGVSPTAVPNTPTARTIAGVAVQVPRLTSPASLPDDVALIVEKGCFQCDGPASGIERLTADVGGTIAVERVFTAPGQNTQSPNKPYILSESFDQPGAYYVVVCSRGYCGALGQPTADAQSTIYQSTDGGVTWTPVKTYDGAATIAGNSSDGVIINRSRDVPQGTGAVTEYLFENLATGETFGAPGAGYHPMWNYNGRLVWNTPDRLKIVETETARSPRWSSTGRSLATGTEGATLSRR